MPASTRPSSVVRMLSDAVATRTGVLLVGQPGSGRRSLIAAIELEEGWRRVRVPGVAGQGRPLEPLMFADLLPTPPAGTPAITAAVHAVTALAARGPVLLVLEDADRLDETTAQVLAEAMTLADITFAASVRPRHGTADPVRILTDRHESTVLSVPPLPFEEIHHIVGETLGGDVDADAIARIYALSGGLPGIARTIAVEARRARLLRAEGTRWIAGPDLWTPALGLVVERLTGVLTARERDAVWTLAALGPSDLATVRRAIPWESLTALDDWGLIRFVDSGGDTLVAVFPPVLEDHLRHEARTARGRAAADAAAAIVVEAAQAAELARPTRPPLGTPVHWSTPEASAILGRLFRADAAARTDRARDAWEQRHTDRSTLEYAQSLLDAGAPHALIDEVLAAPRAPANADSAFDATRIAGLEAAYRGLVRADLPGALDVLACATDHVPSGALILAATEQHLRLLVPGGGPADIPAAATAVGVTDGAVDLPQLRADDVVRMVRGEILLARGRADDAAAVFAEVSPTDPTRYDTDALVPLSMLCRGELDDAGARAARQVDSARATLDRGQLEPHAYVVALSLFLTGRLESLRAYLTGVFATNAPAPLRPFSRAGLLSIATTLAVLERNLGAARAVLAQLTDLPPSTGALPFTRHEPAAAALAVAQGQARSAATRPGWARVRMLTDGGDLLAAILDAARLADLHVDDETCDRLLERVGETQGLLLPPLGAFIAAARARDPERLLACAEDLRSVGLVVFGASAHGIAIRLLRESGSAERATAETERLRVAVRELGDEGRVLASWLERPIDVLTPREQEIARLVAAGETNRDVAERLFVSERTVDNHLYRIFRKLGIGSRDELARLL